MNYKNRVIPFKLVVIFFIGLFVTACSKAEKKEATQTLENQLVEKISGNWLDNNNTDEQYKIIQSKKSLFFGSVELTVKKTEGNKLFAVEKEDERAHCDFELLEDRLMVYRQYEIEQDSKNPSVGGALAPIELRKKRVLTKEALLGSWESVEASDPVYVRINDSFLNKISIDRADDKEFQNVKSETLTLEEDKGPFHYINEEQSTRYIFSYGDKENLLIQCFSAKTGEESQNYLLKKRNVN